jgi:hypothetical protein
VADVHQSAGENKRSAHHFVPNPGPNDFCFCTI